MELNVIQLNCLSSIVAEEIDKMCNNFSGRVELENDTGQSHLTLSGGKVLEVNFKRFYNGIELIRWYLIHPSRSGKYVVVYPHRSQADIISPMASIKDPEKFSRQIAEFKEDNEKVQQYLESISSETEKDEYSGNLKWIIDTKKIFQ